MFRPGTLRVLTQPQGDRRVRQVGWCSGLEEGTPNGVQVSSTFQLQLPACPLPCPAPLLPTSLCPSIALSFVLPPVTLPCLQFGPLGLKGLSFCMTDLSPSLILHPSLSLALGSSQTGRQRDRWGALAKDTSDKNLWLLAPILLHIPACHWACPFPFLASFPICTMGLSLRALSGCLTRQWWLGWASPQVHFSDGEKQNQLQLSVESRVLEGKGG